MPDLNPFDLELTSLDEAQNPKRQLTVTVSPPVPVAPASLIYLNTRSLMVSGQKDKVGYLELLAMEEKALIIAVSETWLHDGIEDTEVKIQNYNIICSDWLGRKGGGLCF